MSLRTRQVTSGAAVLVLTTAIGAVSGMLTSLVSTQWIGRYVLPLAVGLVLAMIAVVVIWRMDRDAQGKVFTARRTATCSAEDGMLRVFVVSSTGALFAASYQEPGIWSPWRDLRPTVPAVDVAATVTSTESAEIFYTDINGQVWSAVVTDTEETHWSRIPGKPGIGRIVSLAAMRGWMGHREIYAVGEHGRVAHVYRWDHNEWSAWGSGDSPVPCRDVTLSVRADGLLKCFTLGTDGQIRHRWFRTPSGWSDWSSDAGKGLPGSGVTIDALNGWPTQEEIFVVRTDGGISHRDHWQGHDWRPWRDLQAPALIKDVAAGVLSRDRLEVIAVDRDGILWQRSYVDQDQVWWGPWRKVRAAIDSSAPRPTRGVRTG